MATVVKSLDRKARGAAVEAAAHAYLQRAGLRRIAANANYRGGELDLIMLDDGGRDGDCVVFIEVRYRSHGGFGGGAASIDAGKRRKLIHAAQSFLAAHRELAHAPCRFDVVEASGDPAAPQLNWLRDAFRADDLA
ncbi:YraN family protein [Lysobacter sp. CFH 32150]|uniref:YraN family protein n=1 Tax=Lysobacter sp. CFH 32150 TaxID=2927128 RepID=UPI001FA7F328|nr:YraN family protein [Lysobacter sp. CFH 32150]MCI4567695.1 YraN family protein [Lysobacter sp. CFH 32150]